MEQIKYRPNIYWMGVFVFSITGIFIVILPRLLSDLSALGHPLLLVIILFSLFLPLNAVFGVYLTLRNNTVSRTDYFIWRKLIKIEDIDQIRSWPTWGVGEDTRTFEVVHKDSIWRNIELSNTAFSDQTIAKLASDLKKKNPMIQIDEYTRQLMEKYADHN